MREKIQAIVNNFGLGISVQNLADEVYGKLALAGENPCIVNERYIEVNGEMFKFAKSKAKSQWIVKQF